MKLLFDQNISFRIKEKIVSDFPNSSQVREVGLENASDKDIWEYTKANDYLIVTFDSDFYDFSLVWGAPPKIILIKRFNQTTKYIAELLKNHKKDLFDFEVDESIDCLEIIKNAP